MLDRLYYIFLSSALLLGLAYPVFATHSTYKSEFSTGRYQNNQFNDEILEIPNAYALIVTISGEIEDKWDVLTLYNANGQKIGTFTGAINRRLEIPGSKIRVVFDSDNRKHDFLGVTVKIQSQSFPKLYQDIKQNIKTKVKELLEKNTGEAAYLITQHLKQLNELDNLVRQAKNVKQVVKPVADELLKISDTYRKIANTQPIVKKTHQNILTELQKLQTKTVQYEKIARENVSKIQADTQTIANSWRKDNLQRVANLLYTQQTLWMQFQQQQIDLANLAKAYSTKVLDFLSNLDTTSQVYKGTADVTLINQATIMDLQNLMDLSYLRTTIDEIQQYETKINSLLNQIEKNNPLS